MQRFHPEINSFTAGELSPRMAGRTDLPQYFKGCATEQNIVSYVHGGATKRQGTKFIATAKDSTNPVKIIPFRYSTEQAYILEFGENYMRVFKDGGIVTVSGSPYFIATDYAGLDLDNIDYTQSADTMYITHSDYPVAKLTREGHNDWTIEDVEFTWGPFLDANTTAVTITPSALTGSITLTASSATFAAGHVGSQWRIGNTLKEETTVDAENTFTDNVYVKLGETLVVAATTAGSWGTTVITVQKTYDSGTTWVDVGTFTSNTSQEIAELVGDVHYTIGCKTGAFDTDDVDVSITLLDQSGYVKITGYSSSTSVSGTVVEELPAITATTDWAEGAWSAYRGYPKTVTFFEQRLIFGGSDYRPQTLWASKVDDYENFDVGTGLNDESYIYSLVSNEVNSIRWMIAADVMRIGTSGGQWKFGFTSTATTPTNVDTKLHSTVGSAAVRPILINGNVLFIQEGGRKLRAMSWSEESQQYISPEMSSKSEHILNYQYGITDMAFQLSPDPIIWMVRFVDGALVGCTFDSIEGVVAFHEHTTQGYFESVATIPGDDRDELWAVVYRENENGNFRAIEQFATPNWDRDNQQEAVFLDSSLVYDGVGATTLSGLDHLDGIEVNVITEGGVHPAVTVSGGIIELDYETDYAVAGLGYDGILETMVLNYPVQGSIVGKKKSIHNATAYFQDTNYAKIGYVESDNNDSFKFRNTVDLMDTAIPLYTGPKTIEFPYGYSGQVSVKIISDEGLPLTVLSIAPTMSTGQI